MDCQACDVSDKYGWIFGVIAIVVVVLLAVAALAGYYVHTQSLV